MTRGARQVLNGRQRSEQGNRNSQPRMRGFVLLAEVFHRDLPTGNGGYGFRLLSDCCRTTALAACRVLASAARRCGRSPSLLVHPPPHERDETCSDESQDGLQEGKERGPEQARVDPEHRGTAATDKETPNDGQDARERDTSDCQRPRGRKPFLTVPAEGECGEGHRHRVGDAEQKSCLSRYCENQPLELSGTLAPRLCTGSASGKKPSQRKWMPHDRDEDPCW